MDQSYFQFCEEQLWQKWLASSVSASAEFRDLTDVDLEAVPEPYLSFGNASNPLIVLTTNPGKSADYQRRAAVQQGGVPFDKSDCYATAAQKSGKYYEKNLPAKSEARKRISRARSLAEYGGHFDGVLQVEAIPFHSRTFSASAKVLAAINHDELLRTYVEQLRALLHGQPVVVISAVGPWESLTADLPLNPWQTWIAGIAGVDIPRGEFLPLTKKGDKTTCAAFHSQADDVLKVLSLKMGSNNLPGKKGLSKLAEAIYRC